MQTIILFLVPWSVVYFQIHGALYVMNFLSNENWPVYVTYHFKNKRSTKYTLKMKHRHVQRNECGLAYGSFWFLYRIVIQTPIISVKLKNRLTPPTALIIWSTGIRTASQHEGQEEQPLSFAQHGNPLQEGPIEAESLEELLSKPQQLNIFCKSAFWSGDDKFQLACNNFFCCSGVSAKHAQASANCTKKSRNKIIM